MACLPWTLLLLFPSTLKWLLDWSVGSIHFILAGNLRAENSRKLLPSFTLLVMWISACVYSRSWKGHSVPCSPGSWAASLWGELSLWAVCLFLNIKAKTHNNRNYCVILIWEQGRIMMHIKFRNILGLYVQMLPVHCWCNCLVSWLISSTWPWKIPCAFTH